MAAKREPPSAQRPLAGQHYWTPLAIFAYEVAAMWPLFAITAKRLHDNGRSLTLAMLAAVALPFADAATLASDYGALDTAPVAISRLPAILIFCTWTGLMWVRAGLQRPSRRRCRTQIIVAQDVTQSAVSRPQARAAVCRFWLLLGCQSRSAGSPQHRRLCGDRPGQRCCCRHCQGRGSHCAVLNSASRNSDASCGHAR
jgi:uncharacterized membrane protein YhaH (DUF805 family)